MLIRAAVFLLLLSSVVQAQATIPTTLQPVDKWTVDYGSTRCTAARSFEPAATPTILAIIPSIDGNFVDLVVSEHRGGPRYAEEMSGGVNFGAGPVRSSLLYSASQTKGYSNLRFRIAAREFARASNATYMSAEAGSNHSFGFALSSMAPLVDALKACSRNLQNYWNYDSGSSAGDRVSQPAKGDVRRLFSTDDYPADAFLGGKGGTAQYDLLVDEVGRVVDCYLANSSGVASLDGMGCQVLLTRAHFTPALNAAGKPIRSVVTTPPVTWMMGQ